MNNYKIIICQEPGCKEFPVIAPYDCPIPKGGLIEIWPDEPMKFVVIRDASREDYESVMEHIRMDGGLERARSFAVPVPIVYWDEEVEKAEEEDADE